MAAETDMKTKKGVLTALKKLEEIRGTLESIDPEHSAFHAPLRLCKALVAGTVSAVYHLLTAIVALSEGEEMPPQMTIGEIVTRASRKTQGLTDEDREAVRTVASDGLNTEDGEHAEDSGATAVTDLLLQVQSHRLWNDSITGGWTGAQRVGVADWCRSAIAGDDLPVPIIVSAQYLEDLDLSTDLDRDFLLSEIGIEVPEDCDWSEDMWDETLKWAESVYRADRGESGIEIPTVPAHILPQPSDFAQVKTLIFNAEGTATRETVSEELSNILAVLLILQTLLELGDVVEEGGTLSADASLIDWSVESLLAAIGNVGRRQPAREKAGFVDNVVSFTDGAGDEPETESEETGEDGKGDDNPEAREDDGGFGSVELSSVAVGDRAMFFTVDGEDGHDAEGAGLSGVVTGIEKEVLTISVEGIDYERNIADLYNHWPAEATDTTEE